MRNNCKYFEWNSNQKECKYFEWKIRDSAFHSAAKIEHDLSNNVEK